MTDGAVLESLLPDNDLTFAVDTSGVTVNDVAISAFDITTNNGVIHVVDGVLLPAT